MGTKYTTISISNYNASPPPDDGSQVSANKVDWSKVKTKLGDPLNTAITSINSSLVTHFDQGPTLKTATYTTTAADYNSVLEVTGTTTINLLSASTGGAGYNVTVKNSGAAVVTVASADNIDGSASVTLAVDNSAMFMVDAGGTTYHMLPGRGVPNVMTAAGDMIYGGVGGAATRLAVGTAGQKQVSDGTDPTWVSTGWEYVDKLDSFDGTTQAEFTDLDAAYDHIFWLHKVRCESNGDTFILRTDSDNGASYDDQPGDYLDRFLNIQSNTSTITNASSLGTSIYAATFLVGEAAGDQYGISGWVYLPNLGAGVNQDIELHTFGYTSVGSWGTSCGHSGIRLDSTAVDAIEFSMVTEQIKSGAIYHYRRKVGS